MVVVVVAVVGITKDVLRLYMGGFRTTSHSYALMLLLEIGHQLKVHKYQAHFIVI